MADAPSQIFDFLFTQGILGVTTAGALYWAVRAVRTVEQLREKHSAEMEAKDKAHKVEIAEWTKLYMEQQRERLEESRNGADRLATANELLAATHFKRGRALDQAS